MDMFRREVDRKLKGEIEVMGKVVNADALIQWINSNAVETEEGSVEPAPPARPRRLHTRHTPMADGGRRSPAAHDDDNSGFAGIRGKALSGLYARASRGVIRLRVHQIDGDRWLNWQENGEDYAGNLGKDIDLIQAELIDCPGYAVEYRASNPGRDYWSWIRNCDNPTPTLQYAGVPGKPIDRVQMRIVGV